jgi:hypothetical protein
MIDEKQGELRAFAKARIVEGFQGDGHVWCAAVSRTEELGFAPSTIAMVTRHPGRHMHR